MNRIEREFCVVGGMGTFGGEVRRVEVAPSLTGKSVGVSACVGMRLKSREPHFWSIYGTGCRAILP